MLKFSRFIVKYRYWFMGVFLALFVGGLFCMGLVKVNYDFTEYLPPDSETMSSPHSVTPSPQATLNGTFSW